MIAKKAADQSVAMAMESCKDQFKWDRWNCPTNDFHIKRDSSTLDREAAFVKSISLAALIYTAAKNCYRDENKDCACTKNIENQRNVYEIDRANAKEVKCINQMVSSIAILNSFSQQNNEQNHLDILGYAQQHNSRAIRTVSGMFCLNNISYLKIKYKFL